MPASAVRAFEDHRRELLFHPAAVPNEASPAPELPWQFAKAGEMPPPMFQLRFQNGEIISFAYSDLREIRFRDAGHVELALRGMAKLLITLEGRNLRELMEPLGCGMVYWVQETDERDAEIPESSPCITAISMLELPPD